MFAALLVERSTDKPVPYSRMHHFGTEIGTFLFQTGVFLGFCDRFIGGYFHSECICYECCWSFAIDDSVLPIRALYYIIPLHYCPLYNMILHTPLHRQRMNIHYNPNQQTKPRYLTLEASYIVFFVRPFKGILQHDGRRIFNNSN